MNGGAGIPPLARAGSPLEAAEFALLREALLVVSALCYVHIEKVGIRLGKRWIQIRRAPRSLWTDVP